MPTTLNLRHFAKRILTEFLAILPWNLWNDVRIFVSILFHFFWHHPSWGCSTGTCSEGICRGLEGTKTGNFSVKQILVFYKHAASQKRSPTQIEKIIFGLKRLFAWLMANEGFSIIAIHIEFYHFIYLQIKHEAAAELVRRKSEPEHARTLKSLAAQEETAASSQGVESKRLVWCRNG